MVKYWLLKSEAACYSIDDLKRDKKTYWDGVRNYQARNMITQDMKQGDMVLFYHSNANPPGIAGLAKICSEANPDFTALDPKEQHFDPKSTPEKPIWWMVDIEFCEKFSTYLGLPFLHTQPELTNMGVLKKGSRLSIQPVTETEFKHILSLGRQKP